ncbi:MAG: DnaD domain protein [Oscillospiraceae bacterium]
MADYILQLAKEESVAIPAAAVDKLTQRGDGDAALLYLCLLRHRGQISAGSVAKELRFSPERQRIAEQALAELGLLGERRSGPVEPAEERPSYSQTDVAERLEGDETFRLLRQEVEKLLGRRLTTADTAILLGLYDYVSLPADVIYQLACHCVERAERSYGPGRRPTLRQIEKEGYLWSRRGIDSLQRANAYLKTYHQRQELLPQYMRALQLGDRAPAPSEEKYLTEWIDMGFPPEAVALAYDRTMLRCHELKWGYLGGILRRWHEKGLHTAEEIERGDSAAPKRAEAPERRAEKDNDIQQYVQRMHRKK